MQVARRRFGGGVADDGAGSGLAVSAMRINAERRGAAAMEWARPSVRPSVRPSGLSLLG